MSAGFHIQPYTGLQAETSELFYLDPRTYNGQSIGASVAGLRYPLLPQSRVEIVRRINFFTSALIGTPKFATNGVMTYAQARLWMLTLVTPSGEVMVSQIPIVKFISAKIAPSNHQFPLYFDRTMLVDTRQSYLECSAKSILTLVPFQFTYAR